MAPLITRSKFRILFLIFGIFFLIAAVLSVLGALTAQQHEGAWVLAIAFGISGLFYIGLAEICDHISIIANNSRVAAEQLFEIHKALQSLVEKKQ
jgi:quinol-cytochrome oxidoreductase complex cytochrome b subunit